jgi:hypothetical protein
MQRVSLVGTVHEEIGLANVSELCAMLQRIQPEIIFLEVPPEAFSDYYEVCSRSNLESKAVRHYRAGYQIQLVPVDLPTPRREFFEDHEYMCARLRDNSREYRQLMDWDRAQTRSYGFAYLNSEHCSTLWSDINSEMLRTLQILNDSRLSAIYDSWRETLVSREAHMMDNIRTYCREHAFEKGAFLLGAAHRQPIIDRSKGDAADDSTTIIWV